VNFGGLGRRVVRTPARIAVLAALLYAEPRRLCQGGGNRLMSVTGFGLPKRSSKPGLWVESWSGFALWATPGQAPFETTFKRSKGLPGRSSKRSFERSLVEAVGIDHAEGREQPKVRFPEPEPETRKAARMGGAFEDSGGGGGNRTHVRGTSIAGFSVCSRLFYLAPWSVSWQPSARPARKISVTAFGRDGNPAHLTSSIPDRRAEPREGRGYLRSQCVVIIGS